LLAPDGLLGFIMPHKFWQAQYGAGLRKLIADGKHLKGVVDFGDQQVFKGATTYTAIHVLSREATKNGVDYAKVVELDDAVAQCATLDSGGAPPGITKTKTIRPAGSEPWSFKSGDAERWCKAVAAATTTLGDVAEVFVGVQTSADDIYHLDLLSSTRIHCAVRSRADEQKWEIERSVLHPLASGQDTRAFSFENPRQVVLYPYEWSGSGRAELLDAGYLETNAPKAWEYLKSHEEALRARESGRFDHDKWYQFGRSQNLGRQKGTKLCVPRLAERLRCAFDEAGDLCLDNVDVNGVRLRVVREDGDATDSYLLLCGIINSLLAESYIRTTVSTHFRGGFASYNRQFIEQLPIKLPTTPEDKKLAARITQSVRAIMDAKTALRQPKLSDRETKQHEAAIEAHEKRIDEAVFALYGVDGLPG
jgi:hypothetical protein